MSAQIPNQGVPAVERQSGLLARAWFVFLTTLTKLPSARLSGSKTYDPPSVAAGGGTTTSVTVPGALLGWDASASFSLDITSLILVAHVSAADTVTVGLFNPTVAPIDIGSGTLTAYVWQP